MLIVYVNHTIPPGTLFTIGDKFIIDRGMKFEPLSVVTAKSEFVMDVDSSMSFVNGQTYVSRLVDVTLDKATFAFKAGTYTVLAPKDNKLTKPEFTFEAEREYIQNNYRLVNRDMVDDLFRFYTGRTGLEVSDHNVLKPATFNFTQKITINNYAGHEYAPVTFDFTTIDVITNPNNHNLETSTWYTAEDFSHVDSTFTAVSKLDYVDSHAENDLDIMFAYPAPMSVTNKTGI